ncbi:TMEM164 family-domain-containing protein [Gilbertella persicaria]|uniref:TMEM164 family-domain-containing protein n=1 Tax=Gilbertella persicaria TaxID=101096 RepID=UPI00221F5483|nr:TMEM164 family-domain-containing protein [Gilbertella persicaria]KAI8078294.1 TMEM164 family-domain-containing protein [Gilbertella persicaria]
MPVVSVLGKSLTCLFDRLEIWVRSVATNVTEETDWKDSTRGSWYLHPRQHAIELLFLSTGFITASIYYAQKVLDPSSTTWQLLSSFQPVGPATRTEKLLIASLLGSFGLTAAHKIIRKNKLFMLQPCHMSAGLLLTTLCWQNKSSVVTNILFNIYLHTQWGAIAALVFPDLRDHYLIGETFNFFAEHILILVAPVYMIYSGRYLVLPPSKNMALLSFSVYSFFHSPVLSICALKSGQNLNYIFSPPPIHALFRIGRGYRVALYATAFGAMFFTRYALVESIASVISRKTLF